MVDCGDRLDEQLTIRRRSVLSLLGLGGRCCLYRTTDCNKFEDNFPRLSP